MASGDVTQVQAAGEVKLSPVTALPMGTVITNSGRVSAARFPGQTPDTPPFSQSELIALDDALKAASEKALVRFSVYIGDLGTDPVDEARKVLSKAPEPANGALIAVSPNSHDVVVVSGEKVADRVNDRVAQLGVTAAIGSFRTGHLIDGLIAALHVVATAAASN
ncbi:MULTISPECIES: DUF5130 domain-containing protein [Gordonia]|uniref:DUF5130 domain-containing protein n=1 Tax=Gordonia TaxID=2053 RepID=UPI0006B21D12|nr:MULTISPECIES: DUF5130 domain-containing protein [Gordonia]EMP12921.2 hypothetical protein ISGA_1433 [Gordonia sp. NB41Y]WLP91254.1 DUF5130 domain-containing protein [Gordonia sp. NB41Y]